MEFNSGVQADDGTPVEERRWTYYYACPYQNTLEQYIKETV